MNPVRPLIAFAAGALFCTALWADLAPWYKWRSRFNDYDICAQTSPGDGWVKVKGPFQDAHCSKPGVPH